MTGFVPRALPLRRGLLRGGLAGGGFTLIELLVVLAILALVAVTIPPAMGRLNEGMHYRSSVQDIAALLRRARLQASTQGEMVTFLIHPQQRSYGILGEPPHQLHDSLLLSLETASALVQADGNHSIVFLPGGGATGGSITVLRGSNPEHGLRLRVDWLSGLVTKELP